jgi:molecular chaperone DnaK
MSDDNNSLGMFNLEGIPPAPRGIPQIEVTFDIDANGIVNVSAKDMGTGKEQSIKITASSGLSEEEIENLIKDAEVHAEEDKKRRELVDARNMADSLIYTTEKSIKEAGDKLDESSRSEIDRAIESLKEAMSGEDAEEIKRLTEALTQASHKMAEAMYAQASQQQEQPGAGAGGEAAGGPSQDEEVVDADFEEVQK